MTFLTVYEPMRKLEILSHFIYEQHITKHLNYNVLSSLYITTNQVLLSFSHFPLSK